MSKPPIWVGKQALLLIHAEGLSLFGGAPGLRDEGLLEGALARPLNFFAYKQVTDLPRLAAAYAFGSAPPATIPSRAATSAPPSPPAVSS